MKIAVFCPNLIGDTVMATPAFRALRQGFPNAKLTLVIKPGVWPTLEGTTWFDEIIRFDPHSLDREERTIRVVRRLRRERFDVAVLFPNSIRSAWIAWLAGIPRRVGFVRHGRGWLLSEGLHYPRDAMGRRLPTPIVESYLKLARQLGCRVDSVRTELATTCDDEVAADLAWSELGLDSCTESYASTREVHLVQPRAGPARISPSWRGDSRVRPTWPCSCSADRMNVLRRRRSYVWLPTRGSSVWPIDLWVSA